MKNLFDLAFLKYNTLDKISNLNIAVILSINIPILIIQLLIVIINIVISIKNIDVNHDIFVIIMTVLLSVLLVSNLLINYTFKRFKEDIKKLIEEYSIN